MNGEVAKTDQKEPWPRGWWRFPLLPYIRTRKAGLQNTSSFCFQWMFFTLWTIDSIALMIKKGPFMNKYLLLMLLSLGVAEAGEFAKKVKDVPEENIFWTQRKAQKKMAGIAALVQGSEFEIKPKAIKKLIKAKKEHISISVLLSGVKEKLLLVKQNPFTYETDSVHYAGIVKGEEDSIVSLSVFDGKITGKIEAKGKKYTIDTEGLNTTVLDITDIKAPEFTDAPIELSKAALPPEVQGFGAAGKVIKVGFEADYQLYQAMGLNATAVQNHFQTLFAQVAALYTNDGFTVQADELFIHTSPDPYSAYANEYVNSINTTLYNFAQKSKLKPGQHLRHLLTSRPGWGGVAFLSVLCNTSYFHGVSSIYTTFSGSASYDWSTNVIAHEMGHNLGSRHTHNCGWVKNGLPNQAIDGFYTPEGSCTKPVVAAGEKGTIMSYSHLSGAMDLRLGFGEQPKAAIQNHIGGATCVAGGVVDSNPPTVNVTYPVAAQVVKGVGANRELMVVANANDDSGITAVDFTFKGPAASTLVVTDTSYPFGGSVNQKDYTGKLLPNGAWTVQAKATDASGKTTLSAVVPFTVNSEPIDKIAPVVSIVKPVNGEVLPKAPYTFEVAASDNLNKLNGVWLLYNGQTFRSWKNPPYTSVVDLTSQPAGTAKLKAYAEDTDGNYTYTPEITIQMGGSNVDTTKPTVNLTSPIALSQVSGSLPVSANASDNVGVVRVDLFAGGVLLSSSTSAPYSTLWDTRTVNNGTVQVRAVAYDAAGNFSESSLGVTVNNPVAQSFGIASSIVGQDKTVADSTKRNWIDLTLTGVVGTPTFQGKALANTSWSTKAGADAVKQPSGAWRIFFFNANTDYQVKAMCKSCSPYAEKIQAFKSLP